MKTVSKFNLANYSEDGDTIDSTFLRMLNDYTHKVKVEVPQSCQYRLDLLAKDFFGDAKLYWVFCVMNSIMHVEELSVGRLLTAVTLTDLERIYTEWRHSNGR